MLFTLRHFLKKKTVLNKRVVVYILEIETRLQEFLTEYLQSTMHKKKIFFVLNQNYRNKEGKVASLSSTLSRNQKHLIEINKMHARTGSLYNIAWIMILDMVNVLITIHLFSIRFVNYVQNRSIMDPNGYKLINHLPF